ncbi:MAG: CHAD domain-containing protein [Planktothrix sp. GU0601_MAG3]|nr:MAG: CHAD domain-containing protein [Planktothrix sp. GU0601_MAG3]
MKFLPDLLLPQISHLFLHPGWQVGVTEEQVNSNAITSETLEIILDKQGESLHDLRKQAKKVRYQMNLFTNFYSSKYSAYLEDIKAIQENLGHIQDSMVLMAKIADKIPSKINSKLPTLISLLAESHYESWQKWQELQQRYLKAENRQEFRLELLNPL